MNSEFSVKKYDTHILMNFGPDVHIEQIYDYASTLQDLNQYKTIVVAIENKVTLILSGKDNYLHPDRLSEVLELYEKEKA